VREERLRSLSSGQGPAGQGPKMTARTFSLAEKMMPIRAGPVNYADGGSGVLVAVMEDSEFGKILDLAEQLEVVLEGGKEGVALDHSFYKCQVQVGA
jgi:hypothetical protein